MVTRALILTTLTVCALLFAAGAAFAVGVNECDVCIDACCTSGAPENPVGPVLAASTGKLGALAVALAPEFVMPSSCTCEPIAAVPLPPERPQALKLRI